MLNANAYLTDADRDKLRDEARDYAAAQGWAPQHADKFPQYHVNRNEGARQSLAMSAQQFRIVKDF
jgi:hypothetical protein